MKSTAVSRNYRAHPSIFVYRRTISRKRGISGTSESIVGDTVTTFNNHRLLTTIGVAPYRPSNQEVGKIFSVK
jgi:hypothetical protein